MTRWRARWAELQNELLAAHGYNERVDHRSLEAQGLDRVPTHHKGPAITALERRGVETRVGWRFREERRREVAARLEHALELGRLEREARALDQSIVALDTDIAAALRAREGAGSSVERARERARKAWKDWRSEPDRVKNRGRDRENTNEQEPARSRKRDGPDYEP